MWGGGRGAKSGRTAKQAPWPDVATSSAPQMGRAAGWGSCSSSTPARKNAAPQLGALEAVSSPPVSVRPPGVERYMLPQWFSGSEARVSLTGGLHSAGKARGPLWVHPPRSPWPTGRPLLTRSELCFSSPSGAVLPSLSGPEGGFSLAPGSWDFDSDLSSVGSCWLIL